MPRRVDNDGMTGSGEREEAVVSEVAAKEMEQLEAVDGSQDFSPLEVDNSDLISSSPGELENGKDMGLSPLDSPSLDSPSDGYRRPLVVHNYENFPFKPSNSARRMKQNAADGLPETTTITEGSSQLDGGTTDPSPPRSRPGSNFSDSSWTPPLPERRYSESELRCSPVPLLSDDSPFSPSPASSDGYGAPREHQATSHETASPHHSRSQDVQREVSEQGNEYAVVNPAWKKNVKGRPPSLSGENDGSGRSRSETPPPLPNRPARLPNAQGHPGQNDTQEFVDMDSDLVTKKKVKLDTSNRFNKSVKYTEVQIASQPPPASSKTSQNRGRVGAVAYDVIDFQGSQVDGELQYIVLHVRYSRCPGIAGLSGPTMTVFFMCVHVCGATQGDLMYSAKSYCVAYSYSLHGR